LFDIEYHQISELISLAFDYSFIRNITITFIWFYFYCDQKNFKYNSYNFMDSRIFFYKQNVFAV